MSLFQCQHCGCCENTALSYQDCALVEVYDWSYAPERQGLRLCSACRPTHYRDGSPTGMGQWHDEFSRVFLPKDMFHTNRVGNLAHNETGDENFRAYAIKQETSHG